MNKKAYLHDNKDKKDLVKHYYIALIPLILFSIYKNGILLYNNDLISLKDCFLPLYFYGVSILVAILLSFIYHEKKEENILFSLIIACSISINANMLLYPVILFAGMFILKYIKNKTKLKFNSLALLHFILLLSLLLQSYSYLNVAEKLNKFSYNLFDIFLGHGNGGIGTTSLFAILISFLILGTNKYYKKRIALSATISFSSALLFVFLFTENTDYLKFLVNGSAYFAFLFVASDLYTSPYHEKGMMIYGVFIGLLSAVFTLLINLYEGPYLAILLISIFIPLINRISNKKYLHF